jgi:hypothetical protein
MNINKLPKWAQEHIKKLERERDTAINTLKDYCNHKKPSPIYTEDLVCIGEKKGPSSIRNYIQTYKITINHQGIELNIICREEGIDMSWGDGKFRTKDVAFIPWSHQQAYLVSKENMR